MDNAPANVSDFPTHQRARARFVRTYLNWIGRWILRIIRGIQGIGAFALITIAVTIRKFYVSHHVVHPVLRMQIYRAGVRLLPMITFIAFALGLVVIGQTVSLLSRVGATTYAGTIMVTVIVRELGPLAAALLVLARVGTAYVIELGTNRALGEVETLEALGIDPIHFLVMPRVLGLAISVFALTIYLIILALLSGYLIAFIQDVPLRPADYFSQLAAALSIQDFILLGAKTIGFGLIIGIVSCYQGLSRPIRLDEVSTVTTLAVVQSVIGCMVLDILFILFYLLV